MNRGILLLLLICAGCSRCCAQGENNIWIAARNIGLDFRSGTPQPFPVIPEADDAAAAISDRNGNLLFFSDGTFVRDRNQQVMPNGMLVQRDNGYNDYAPLIIPFVGDTGKYYLFTRSALLRDRYYAEIYYSVIDMSLNGGLGDVVPDQKMILLAGRMGRMMLPVKGDGCFIWLLTHLHGKAEFLAFRIDHSGISHTPVRSETGFPDLSPYHYHNYAAGNMVISSDHKTLVFDNGPSYRVELYRFDHTTGAVSDAYMLDEFGLEGRAHSVCLSPDNTKVYLTGGASGSDLMQYDISGFPANRPVRTVILDYEQEKPRYHNGQLRLGPDGKIYISSWEGIHCIQYPDLPGKACMETPLCVALLPEQNDPRPYSLGINTVPDPYRFTHSASDTVSCKEYPVTLPAPPGFSSYLWDDSSTGSRMQTDPRKSLYRVISRNECETRTDTFRITYVPCNCDIRAPNAFSPNNDGINDLFRLSSPDISTIDFAIYNRYGQPVFSTATPGAGWDGSISGTPAAAGTYFYHAVVTCKNGLEKSLKGDVTLLR